jgi:tRNA(Met) cytidine acetyltransferase
VQLLGDADALWIGPDDRRVLRRMLGRAFDAVVLDAHDGFDADVLGQAHGMIWGGGALVLRRSHTWSGRFDAHVERCLRTSAGMGAVTRATLGTAEQAAMAERLRGIWGEPGPSRVVLTADRGRGKSSAVGLALRDLGRRVAVSAAHPDAVREVERFSGLPFVPLATVLRERFDVVVIDEAAQIPVPTLQRIVKFQDAAHLAFSTTTHGYEGTGRGFALRFVDWLAPDLQLQLREPIRWAEGDPLERMIFAALLLDCELAAPGTGEITIETLDRDRLSLPRLREFFGLLVHAHYRTTPGDLQRMLDAPELQLHAALQDGHVVGATVVAAEGALERDLCEAAARGGVRLKGHALADALVAHMGMVDAGVLQMRRSVRIAVHPALRRRGIATRLVEHVHRTYDPDLFGTMFGATADLVAFRRSLGYEVVRVSASRGTRTGEPSVMMLNPRSPAARDVVHRCRQDLARELPLQLQLLQADEELALDPALVNALHDDLPTPTPLTADEARSLAHAYAHGPRTFESCATAVIQIARGADLSLLPDDERIVLEQRALARRGWLHTTRVAGLSNVRTAMRSLRKAVRRLV